MEARANARYIRMSPRKIRLVADLVRGKSVEEAINLLHFTPKRGSVPVEKLLRSAVANALNMEEGSKLDPEDFFIGPMGRASLIRKRSCHISVIISDELVTD